MQKFVAEGARVIVADRDGAAARRVAEALGEAAAAATADISTEAGVAGAVAEAQSRFGGLDILVNNAGVGHTPSRSKPCPRRCSTASPAST